jgi:hypothetical protein
MALSDLKVFFTIGQISTNNHCSFLDQILMRQMNDFNIILFDSKLTDSSKSHVKIYCPNDNRFEYFSRP